MEIREKYSWSAYSLSELIDTTNEATLAMDLWEEEYAKYRVNEENAEDFWEFIQEILEEEEEENMRVFLKAIAEKDKLESCVCTVQYDGSTDRYGCGIYQVVPTTRTDLKELVNVYMSNKGNTEAEAEIVWSRVESELNKEFKEHDVVVLNQDFTDLKAGTVGAIVHIHSKEYNHYEVEFVDTNAQTIGVYITPVDYLNLLISRNTPE
jgi:hypothetical protein